MLSMDRRNVEEAQNESWLSPGIQMLKTFKIGGDIASQWVKIGTNEGLTTDAQIASFLIQHYINCQHRTKQPVQCDNCHKPLTLVCANCQPQPRISTSSANGPDFPSKPRIAKNVPLGKSCGLQTKLDTEYDSSDVEGQQLHSPESEAHISPLSDKTQPKPTAQRRWVDIPNRSTAQGGKRVGHRKGSHAEVACGKNGSLQKRSADLMSSAHFDQTLHHSTNSEQETKITMTHTALTVEENKHKCNEDRIEPSSYEPNEMQMMNSVPYKLRKNTGHGQSVKRPYSCSKCDSTFKWRHHLRGHLQKVHGVKDFFPCQHCGQDFSAFSRLQQHRKTHKNTGLHLCTECDASFQKAFQLTIHMRKHTGEKPFVCSICGSAFSTKHKLKNHDRRHTGEKPYTCQECGATFAQSQYLKDHMRTHTGEKPYMCTECGATFSQYCALKKHLRSHSTVKPYICKICEKAYKNPYSLSRHTRHEHDKKAEASQQSCKQSDVVEKLALCEECGKIFKDPASLRKHMYVHSDDRPFICKECGAAFLTSAVLKKHTRTHSGEKPHMCSVCGKAFIQAFNLTRHMTVHSDERRHVCSEVGCGAAFKVCNELKQHERIHMQYKPHVCQFCSVAFVQLSNLKQHVRMHTDERPYVCEICGKAFRRLNQLKMHSLMHSGLKPCICIFCGASFRKSQTLKTHMQKKHAYIGTSSGPGRPIAKQECNVQVVAIFNPVGAVENSVESYRVSTPSD